jgi:hypothetical protein
LPFLAPLFAIAVYFLLTVFGLEGGNSIYTIAIISFTVGLVTEEVVKAFTGFTRSKLKGGSHGENDYTTINAFKCSRVNL